MATREQMIVRQEALAAFGDFAQRSSDLDEVLHEGCRIVADALGADLSKILEFEEKRQELLVKAGLGWKPGVVGHTRIPMSGRSSEAYAIELAEPVISNDIEREERFDLPEFLSEHGVVALVNVPIFLAGGRPYGLLQVDSRTPREFDQADIAFLRTYATVLGPVIDRLHKSHSLHEALEINQRLLRELQHRVKNQFGIVTSLLRMARRRTSSTDTRRELAAVDDRVETMRLLNEQLYIAGTIDSLRLRSFVMQLVENLIHLADGKAGTVRLDFAIEEVEVSPETAVALGLILNEFVTNSLTHGFDGTGGVIKVEVEAREGRILRLRVGDNGKGLPPGPQDPRPGYGTGMMLIQGLAQQIGATPIWSSAEPGAVLRLEFASND